MPPSNETKERWLLAALARRENPYEPKTLQVLAQVGGIASLSALQTLAKTSARYAASPQELERMAITYAQVTEDILKRHPEYSTYKQQILESLFKESSYVKAEDLGKLLDAFDGPTDALDDATIDAMFDQVL